MKMLKMGLFLVALGLWGCADDIDEFRPDAPIDPGEMELVGDIGNFFDAIDESEFTENFSGYADWGFMIVTKHRTIIDFPPNSLIDPLTGDVVTGLVDVDLIELRTRGEMLLMGIPTESYGTILESGGEFRLTVSQNGKKLGLQPGKQIQFRVEDDNPQNEMELWYTADVTLNAAGDVGTTWDDADDDPNTWSNVNVSEWTVLRDSVNGGGDVISGFGYECWSDSLNWINIDVFKGLPDDEVTDACVALPDSFGNTNTIVYLVFEDLNSVINLPGNPETMQFCNYYYKLTTVGIPLGASVKFITISELGDDNYYLGLSETIITPDHLENIEPVSKTFEEIKEFLLGL
jgi:hypothetical protein